MKRDILGIAAFILVGISIVAISWKPVEVPHSQQEALKNIAADSIYNQYISNLYHAVRLDSAGLNEAVFEKALTGYYNMKYAGMLHGKSILTIADFDQESRKKRLYIIDIDKKTLLLNTWVAHGEKSGGDKANQFSNSVNSYQSSLGFYLTGEVYFGKHGRSLKLDGMDQDFNGNARERAVVVHGASYVCQETINELGRLGRSQGCPAVPAKLTNTVINTMADHTVLFINNSDQVYYSSFLNEQLAANLVQSEQQVFAANMD